MEAFRWQWLVRGYRGFWEGGRGYLVRSGWSMGIELATHIVIDRLVVQDISSLALTSGALVRRVLHVLHVMEL